MAKAPDPRRVRAQQVKEASDAVRWVITVDDKEYIFRLSEVTALDAGELRRAARMNVRDMVVDAADDQLDAQASVIWLARRQAGEVNLPWRDVAEELTVGTVVYVRHETDTDADEAEPFPDPPALGGGSGD